MAAGEPDLPLQGGIDIPLFNSNYSEAEQDWWVKTHVYSMG